MRQLPVPPELVPEGGELSQTGYSYADAWELPLANVDPDANGQTPRMALVRTSQLLEFDTEEVQQMARNGWRIWVRVAAQGTYIRLDPVVPIARPYPWLDSDVPDTGPLGGNP